MMLSGMGSGGPLELAQRVAPPIGRRARAARAHARPRRRPRLRARSLRHDSSCHPSVLAAALASIVRKDILAQASQLDSGGAPGAWKAPARAAGRNGGPIGLLQARSWPRAADNTKGIKMIGSCVCSSPWRRGLGPEISWREERRRLWRG